MTQFALGVRVRDKVTGLEGIAIARHEYLYGCTRISIQPAVDKDGKVPESYACDAPQLEILGESIQVMDEDLQDPGGPDKFMDSGKPAPIGRD